METLFFLHFFFYEARSLTLLTLGPENPQDWCCSEWWWRSWLTTWLSTLLIIPMCLLKRRGIRSRLALKRLKTSGDTALDGCVDLPSHAELLAPREKFSSDRWHCANCCTTSFILTRIKSALSLRCFVSSVCWSHPWTNIVWMRSWWHIKAPGLTLSASILPTSQTVGL